MADRFDSDFSNETTGINLRELSFLEDILEQLPVGVVVISPNSGKFLFANNRAALHHNIVVPRYGHCNFQPDEVVAALAQLVQMVANQGPDLQNSYPRWAPLSDDDVMWLAFSSRRLYAGQDVPMPNVWVSAIDAAAAEVGQDPSSPAFWLPGQDHGTDNHLAVWWEE